MEPELKKKNKFLEIKKNIKKNLLPTLLIMIGLFGLTYAFFIYRGSGDNRELVAGQLYLNMDESDGFLTLQSLFPETKEQARARDDNTVTFTVTGRNESNQNIYYEINLNEGEELSGYERFNANDLVFDLVEIGSNGKETYLAEATSYDNLNKVRMWVDNVASNNTNFSKTYRLRMWLNENIVISDTESDADYTTEEFMNSYAGIKVGVYGDFEYKRMPYNYMTAFPTTISNQKSNITEVNFVNMETSEMESRYNAATIKADLTDTTKSSPGLVYGWLETDTTDTSKYILYVASDGTTFFPTSCSQMFYSWSNLKNVNFENIDTTKVTNMSHMFSSCSKLTSLDISGFVTTSVTNMSYMFNGCSSLTSLDLNNFVTTSVTNMSGMFRNCKVLTSLDVSGFVTASVTTMGDMFCYCTGLTSLDVSGFVTASVTNMSGMFYNCSGLTSLDLTNFVTTSVTDMSQMFSGCSKLTSLDVSGFVTTSVTNMYGMFSYCSGLASLDLTNFVTTSVTNMSYMFQGCSGLTSLDLTNFVTTSVTNMFYMFQSCSGLTTIYANTDWNTTTVTSSNNMFLGCSKLKGAISYDSSKVDVTYANPTTGYFTPKTA